MSDVAREALSADLAKISAGDRAALRRVYDATSAKLLGICLRVLKDRASADEALQDAYVKVWLTAGRFDPGRASPVTWLSTVARNTAIDRLRRRQTRGTPASDVPEELADERPPADLVIEAREEQRRVQECMDRLNDRQAHCIRAAFYDGASYPQLAERLEVPLGTMKSWIRRGLLSLRECLDHG